MKKFMIVITIIASSCSLPEKKLQEDKLNLALTSLDNLLLSEQFNYDAVTRTFLAIDSNLNKSRKKSFNNSLWNTQAEFKANGDSSVLMFYSIKKSKNGFKRESIIQIRDSVLVIMRFEVLTDDETLGYELLETFDYLTKTQNIKTLVRREYPRPLSDTVYLREQPFLHYESEDVVQFVDELEYAQRIMSRN